MSTRKRIYTVLTVTPPCRTDQESKDRTYSHQSPGDKTSGDYSQRVPALGTNTSSLRSLETPRGTGAILYLETLGKFWKLSSLAN